MLMTTYNQIRVLDISGSLPRDSRNTALLRADAKLMLPETTLEAIDLSDLLSTPLLFNAGEFPFHVDSTR
jgi:hypothetical protein